MAEVGGLRFFYAFWAVKGDENKYFEFPSHFEMKYISQDLFTWWLQDNVIIHERNQAILSPKSFKNQYKIAWYDLMTYG